MEQMDQSELIKVAIFSDLHVDYEYKAGMNTECGRITCCHAHNGDPSVPE